MLETSTWRRRSLRVMTVAFVLPLSGIVHPDVLYAQTANDYIAQIQPPAHEFANGFEALFEQLGPTVMGVPVEDEHPAEDAEAAQLTTTGLAVWHKGQAPAFTDGWKTYTLAGLAKIAGAASVPSVAIGPPVGIWDRLAQCESGGNWAANTGNGFHAGLQFLLSTWYAYGGMGLPEHASRAQQIAVAQRIQAVAGWGQWPACSRKLGLR